MNRLLIGLVPACLWGIQPVIMKKMGGTALHQTLGITTGNLLFNIVLYLLIRPVIPSTHFFLISFLSGLSWTVGLYLQILAFELVGVARTMPLSSGTQIIGTALFGVFFFGEWQQPHTRWLGWGAILVILIGIILSAYTQTKTPAHQRWQAVLLTVLSTCGFVGYAVLPRSIDVGGIAPLLPQAFGMYVGAWLVYAYRHQAQLNDRGFRNNILTGFNFAIASMSFLISNQLNGLAVGFTLSQMNVVVATLSGMCLLHEHKTRKEIPIVFTGLFLVVVGGVLIGMTK